MDDTTDRDSAKQTRLTFSGEFFADYHTSLVSRIRADDSCEELYTGYLPHPLIELQQRNQQQILDYGIELVAPAVLEHTPFEPTEYFIRAVKRAATASNNDPPLRHLWSAFLTGWKTYKSTQRKIYAIIVATLRVGTSVHYARSVPFGAGMRLLNNILADNQQMTTRALFALFANLFTLKIKDGEAFETYKIRFDLIINRFANWQPPIILPEPLLLFFVLRGLPNEPYGPTRHIILVTENIDLKRGLQLLSDVGQSEVGLINSTMGPGPASSAQTPDSNILALRPAPQPQPTPRDPTKKSRRQLRRERKMSKLYKELGPCEHHGPKSLHATCECNDPNLTRRNARRQQNKQRNTTQVNTAASSEPASASAAPRPQHRTAAPSAFPYPQQPMYQQPTYPTAPMYPPAAFGHPMPQYAHHLPPKCITCWLLPRTPS